MDIIRQFEQQQIADSDRPELRPGDVVAVAMKVKEGEKERLQSFEGVVLGIRGSGPSVTFTVRREVGRFAVERIFPLHSPLITSINILKRQKVRRAKLGYLRTAGRRRVKEDVLSMQRYLKVETDKKRLIEQAQKKAEEEALAAERAKQRAEAKAEAEAKDATTADDTNVAETATEKSE